MTGSWVVYSARIQQMEEDKVAWQDADGPRFYHALQNGMQLTTYACFSKLPTECLSDQGLLQVVSRVANKTHNTGRTKWSVAGNYRCPMGHLTEYTITASFHREVLALV